MSEWALERARAKARRRHRKPWGLHPGGSWWLLWIWLAVNVTAYLRDALERSIGWGVFDGLLTVVFVAIVRWHLAWWRWERKEGIPRPRLGRRDWAIAAFGVVLTCLNLAWVASLR